MFPGLRSLTYLDQSYLAPNVYASYLSLLIEGTFVVKSVRPHETRKKYRGGDPGNQNCRPTPRC